MTTDINDIINLSYIKTLITRFCREIMNGTYCVPNIECYQLSPIYIYISLAQLSVVVPNFFTIIIINYNHLFCSDITPMSNDGGMVSMKCTINDNATTVQIITTI